MGKKPDQIERDIREHRAQITRRMEGLRSRVEEDVETVKLQAKERAGGAIDDAKGTLKVDSVKEMMQEHTITTMAGALGVGVLLGVVSESIGSSDGSSNGGYSSDSGYRTQRKESGAGLGALMSSLITPAAATAQRELQDLVREGFGTLKQQVGQAQTGRNGTADTT